MTKAFLLQDFYEDIAKENRDSDVSI